VWWALAASPAWAVAKRLECGQLAPAFGRDGRAKSAGQPDALQTLARLRSALCAGQTDSQAMRFTPCQHGFAFASQRGGSQFGANIMKRPSKLAIKAKTIDEFLARLSSEQRAALQRLRAAMHAAALAAEECTTYGVPASSGAALPLLPV